MAAELDALEAQLPVSDILLFRLLAEHTSSSPDLHPASLEPGTDSEPGHPGEPGPDPQATADTARCLLLTT